MKVICLRSPALRFLLRASDRSFSREERQVEPVQRHPGKEEVLLELAVLPEDVLLVHIVGQDSLHIKVVVDVVEVEQHGVGA